MLQQVILPLLVNHAQHDHALVMAQADGPNEFLFRVVALFQLRENGVAQFLPVQVVGLYAFGEEVNSEAREQPRLSAP